MGFFPPISVGAPTFKDSPQDPMPWEQGFGKTAITDVVLAEGREGAVLLRSVIAYPSVMTLVTVPLGTAFQFRTLGEAPLVFLAVTMPPWPGAEEAYVVEGKWPPTAIG